MVSSGVAACSCVRPGYGVAETTVRGQVRARKLDWELHADLINPTPSN